MDYLNWLQWIGHLNLNTNGMIYFYWLRSQTVFFLSFMECGVLRIIAP